MMSLAMPKPSPTADAYIISSSITALNRKSRTPSPP